MLFTGLGRSVLGKTVPSLSSTGGLGPYSKPRVQFFPIRTSQAVNNIYFSQPNTINKIIFSVVIIHAIKPHSKIRELFLTHFIRKAIAVISFSVDTSIQWWKISP